MPTDRVHHLIDIKLARGFSRWRRHAGVQLAQAAQQCTRYDSNALDTTAMH